MAKDADGQQLFPLIVSRRSTIKPVLYGEKTLVDEEGQFLDFSLRSEKWGNGAASVSR